MKNLLVLLFLTSASVFSFSTVSDTAKQDTLSNEYIIKKLEAIDAKLTQLLSEKTDNNPLATGAQVNWGKGFTFIVRPDFSRLSAEIGYIFKPRKLRYGVFCGGHLASGMTWRPNYLNTGVSIGSPVLMNFVSVSGNYEILYFTNRNFGGGVNSRVGQSMNFNLEIWAMPQLCFTLGSQWVIANREIPEPGALKGAFSFYDYARFGFRVVVPSKSRAK